MSYMHHHSNVNHKYTGFTGSNLICFTMLLNNICQLALKQTVADRNIKHCKCHGATSFLNIPRIHPLRTMNVCTKLHGYTAKTCKNLSI